MFCGDGCLQEGISSEAGSLAGHLGLGKLIVFYDDNHITIDGETELSFTEDVLKRYEAYGWHVQQVYDGNHDLAGLGRALEAAQKVHDRPSMIKVTTTIGFGSAKQGTEAVHGAPLSKDDLANVKKSFGFDPAQAFVVPADVKALYDRTEAGKKAEADWQQLLARYTQQYPELAAEFSRRVSHQLPAGWEDALPKFSPKDAAAATRKSSQSVILALGKVLPELVGGSADLNPSCFTYLDYSKDFQKHSPEGRSTWRHVAFPFDFTDANDVRALRSAVWCARARDVRGGERPGCVRQRHVRSVRLHVLQFHRLRVGLRAAVGAVGLPRAVHHDARLHRPGRGRSHSSGH